MLLRVFQWDNEDNVPFQFCYCKRKLDKVYICFAQIPLGTGQEHMEGKVAAQFLFEQNPARKVDKLKH
jgi:hypothetical protein